MLEGLARRHVGVGHAVGVRVGQVVAAQQVAPAQLDRVEAQLAGGDVEDHLPGHRLELPRAAVGGAPHAVGEHRPVLERGRRDPVGTREDHADGRAHAHRPGHGVGAHVLDVVDVGGEDRAVVVEGHLDPRVLVAGLPGRHQVLAPVLDPLDRPWQAQGGQHHAPLLAQRHDLLAEATAGVAHDHPDAVLGQVQQARAHRPDLVRSLGGGPDRHLLGGGIPLDHDAARLHRHRGVGLLPDGLVHHVGGGGQRLGHLVPRAAGHLPDEVALVALVHLSLGLVRGGVVDHGGPRVVVDHHQLGRVLGDVPAVGHHQGHRVAGETDLALGQGRQGGGGPALAREAEPHLVGRGVELGRGEHGVHPIEGQGLGGIDGHDGRPGERAAHEAGVQHPRPHDVVHERAPTGEQSGVLHPVHPAAGVAGRADDAALSDRAGCGHEARPGKVRFLAIVTAPWVRGPLCTCTAC